MDNHAILDPALQKYYSALKSLDAFGRGESIFDDVSSLDTFFSEFRNITFMVQKGLCSDENKAIYAKMRAEFLCGDTLKWFIDARNKTTKEKPFDLWKELQIDIYLPCGLYTLKNTRLVVNMDTSLDNALKYIRSVFFDELKLVEIYFTSRVVFREADNEIDLCPKIKTGIIQMNSFMNALEDYFPCNCGMCAELKKKTSDLFKKVQSKELLFIKDYSLEKGEEPNIGDQVEMYLSKDGLKYTALSNLRLSLDNPVFKEAQGCLRNVFLRFAAMHTMIFQMQNHQIIPVFMVVYKDQTYRMISFVATSKATYFRKVIELVNLPDFNEVDAVLYCGEYYVYDIEQISEINENPYSKRIGMAQSEVLAFVIMARGNSEMSLIFNEREIDNTEYVAEQFNKASWIKNNTIEILDWLNPIRRKLNEDVSN